MTQYGRPNSDIATGGWTSAPLWSKIDEAVASDLDYITTNANFTCKVGLTSLADPTSSSDHIIRYRHIKTMGTTTVTMYLYQGTTLIASQAVEDTTSWVTSSYTLSAAEADSITDYTDLRIWFTAAVTAGITRVSWCVFECPDFVGSVVTIPNTPDVDVVTINPTITGTAVVTIPNTPDVAVASITPTGVGIITVVTIPNTPNISVVTISPSAGVTVPLIDNVALDGTFIVNTDLTGTFITNVALDGTFDTTESLDGTI